MTRDDLEKKVYYATEYQSGDSESRRMTRGIMVAYDALSARIEALEDATRALFRGEPLCCKCFGAMVEIVDAREGETQAYCPKCAKESAGGGAGTESSLEPGSLPAERADKNLATPSPSPDAALVERCAESAWRKHENPHAGQWWVHEHDSTRGLWRQIARAVLEEAKKAGSGATITGGDAGSRPVNTEKEIPSCVPSPAGSASPSSEIAEARHRVNCVLASTATQYQRNRLDEERAATDRRIAELEARVEKAESDVDDADKTISEIQIRRAEDMNNLGRELTAEREKVGKVRKLAEGWNRTQSYDIAVRNTNDFHLGNCAADLIQILGHDPAPTKEQEKSDA